MTVIIRPAIASDGPQVYRLWNEIRELDAAFDSRAVPRPIAEPDFLADWAVQLARTNSRTIVAADGDEVAGFVTTTIEPGPPARDPERHATVGYLYVRPSERRTGIGRRLFGAVREWASEHEGVSHVEMTVLAANGDAIAFWKALGFSPFIERLWAPLDGPHHA